MPRNTPIVPPIRINDLLYYLSANQQALESIIMRVPTGEARNQLTDCNIKLLDTIAELKKVQL